MCQTADLLSFCKGPHTCLSELSVSLKWRRLCVYLGCGDVAKTQCLHESNDPRLFR